MPCVLKPFKSGNSLALRIPASVGLSLDDNITLTTVGEGSYLLTRKTASREDAVDSVFETLHRYQEAWADVEAPVREPARDIPEW